MNQKSQTIELINTKKFKELPGDNIKSLHITKEGKLWIGTFNNGMAIYDFNTNEFDKLPFPKKLYKYMKNNGVLTIMQYDKDVFYLGTRSRGVVKYNLKTKDYVIFNARSKRRSITTNYIKTIEKDKDGNIWVGTLRGLNKITPNDEVTKYTYTKDLKVKFEINTIVEDHKGRLWLGTTEDGLFKFENEQFEPVELKIENTTIDGIKSILKSDSTKFCIGTYTQGIIKYNTASGKIEAHYTEKQGLSSDQFNRNSKLKIGTSKYYFGGPHGVTYFNEETLVKNTHTPQVILTDFKISNKSISVDNTEKILKNTITYTEAVELDHNQGNFSLSFAIPNFINSKNNSYKCRLKGIDTDWITTTNNSASYTIQKN